MMFKISFLNILLFSSLLLLVGCSRKSTTEESPSTIPALPTVSEADMVEHPIYSQWSKFPVGTRLVQQTTTDSLKTEGKTVTKIVYVLKEKTDKHVSIESQATTYYHGGRVDENPSEVKKTNRLVQLPQGMKKEDWGKETGKKVEEEIVVLGKKYKAYKLEAKGNTDVGKLYQTTWNSPEIPGGLLKSVTLVPAAEETTTIEVIELKIPQ